MKANNFSYIFPFVLIAILFLFACNKKDMPALTLIKWVEATENGLAKQRNIGDWKLNVQYEPLAYLQAKSHVPLNKADTEAQNNLHYFRFTIDVMDSSKQVLKEGVYTTQEYLHRIQYFSFGMEQDLYLVSENDTLKPALFHYERNYGLKHSHTFSVAFEIPTLKKDRYFVWNAKELRLGIVKMGFEGNNLLKANELHLK